MLEDYLPTIVTIVMLIAVVYVLYRIIPPEYEEDCEC